MATFGALGYHRQVNVLAPPKARLSIEVVHDLVCPWCYLGTRRLLRTVRRRPDLLVDIVWRPFLLNPDMPRAGMARSDYVVRKFGGEDRARRLYRSISDVGQAEGLMFHFDRVRRTPSSVDAHRLVRWATRFGRADAMVEALFAAHFSDGRDLGDVAVLAAVALSCGLDPAAARAMLLATRNSTPFMPTTCGRTGWASTACPASSSAAATPSPARRSPR